jgi:hypothetical protein
VTCYAGLNRSGLISALALHMITEWPLPVIIDAIRAKRGPHALSNPRFVELLQQLVRGPRPNQKPRFRGRRR